MVMSIIAAVCAGGQMIFDSIAASIARYHSWYLCDDYDYNYYYYGYSDSPCGAVSIGECYQVFWRKKLFECPLKI